MACYSVLPQLLGENVRMRDKASLNAKDRKRLKALKRRERAEDEGRELQCTRAGVSAFSPKCPTTSLAGGVAAMKGKDLSRLECPHGKLLASKPALHAVIGKGREISGAPGASGQSKGKEQATETQGDRHTQAAL